MRGSPLLRTLIVLAALLVTGLALARLTHSRSVQAPVDKEEPAAAPVEIKKASFELFLSSTAKEISLDAGAAPATTLSGSLEVPGDHPVISLRVAWTDNSPGHRFAKLRLEIPGKPTLEHVFDSSGDIDDIWEP
ncbi:hypothetical protein [Luteolibacter sp. Populi]|uniref:hypothetical protein n=1 Tax=Luteolibacter sp. Populi TaxID=3230487 RepID=UPI0034670599